MRGMEVEREQQIDFGGARCTGRKLATVRNRASYVRVDEARQTRWMRMCRAEQIDEHVAEATVRPEQR